MCFSLFSNNRSRKTPSPRPAASMPPSKSPAGRSDTPRGSTPRRHSSHEFFHNSTSMEYNFNSTSTASSSSSAHHYKLPSRVSTFAAGRDGTSLSSLRDSLPENPHIYNFTQIRSATSNFVSKPVHRSSTSTSWRCFVEGKDAIVTLRRLRRPISTDELRDKLTRICRSHHAGLVRLYGASISGNSIYLVYERIEGASLSECLRNPKNPSFTVLSNWLSRIQIATDVAEAIDYLHNSSGMKIGFVHNHIKTGSIIVKEPSMNGKLCHLGTAQLCWESVETATPENNLDDEISETDDQRAGAGDLKKSLSGDTKFEGTRGYMSPEFQSSGMATRKSDVFAFGVVLLELLTGEEPIKFRVDEETGAFEKASLIDAAREVVGGGGGKLRKWVDWRLKDSFPVEVVERMTLLAVECVEEDPGRRPDMGRVAGVISKLYLESQSWAEKMGVLTDFSVTLGPR